jgi:hypothetical protein
MRDEVVAQAVGVSRDLQAGIGNLDAKFSFLREVLGVTHRNLEPESPRAENWGYLVREMVPFPVRAEQGGLVPGFSLYGKDFFSPGRPPLFYDLLAGRDPVHFLLDEVMIPIIQHWVACFLNFGFLLEPHGQNVLLELGASGSVRRIVYRDLNLGIDNRRRRDINIPIDTGNRYNQMESGEFASITYDKFMGGHFFDRLVTLVQEDNPDYTVEDFRGPCRDEFAKAFPDHADYLPRTIQYFSEKRDRFGKPLYQDTGTGPVWRP